MPPPHPSAPDMAPRPRAMTAALMAAAFALAMAYALPLYGLDFVTGHGVFWTSPGHDPLQSLVGLRAFLADRWRFPLLHTSLINGPEGQNIAYTDSIPLLALATKAVRWPIAEGWHYFGWWILACHGLNAATSVWLITVMGARGIFAPVVAAGLSIMLPVMLDRIEHPALHGFFIINLAIGLYWQASQGRPWAFLWFVLLLPASLFIHPYLAFMAACFFAISLVPAMRGGPSGARAFAISAIAIFVLCGGVIVAGGYLTPRSPSIADPSLYGTFSMDLLAPLFEGDLSRWPDDVEGYLYVGAGVMLLALAAVFIGGDEAGGTDARRHWPVWLLCGALTAAAVTHMVHIGGALIFTVPLPHWLTALLDVVRASARLFWPVIIVLTHVAIVRVFGGGLPLVRAAPAALIILAVQWADTADVRARVSPVAHHNHPRHAQVLNKAVWSPVVAASASLFTYPSYQCLRAHEGIEYASHRINREFQLMASLPAIPTNTARSARFFKDCTREDEGFEKLAPDDGVLLVIHQSIAAPPRAFAGMCKTLGWGTVCGHAVSALAGRDVTGAVR